MAEREITFAPFPAEGHPNEDCDYSKVPITYHGTVVGHLTGSNRGVVDAELLPSDTLLIGEILNYSMGFSDEQPLVVG